MIGAVLSTLLLSTMVQAEVSPLCEDLARFSCAPGNYKDGTGEVKSEQEVAKMTSDYAQKAQKTLSERFEKVVKDPENDYFRQTAIAALGLSSSPQCSSSDPVELQACEKSLIEGLTGLAQKQTLSGLFQSPAIARRGNLKDMAYIVESASYQRVVADFVAEGEKELGQPELSKKIEGDIFPKVKKLLIERLNQLDIPDKQRKHMVDKVRAIKFNGTRCELGGGYGSSYGGGEGAGSNLSSYFVPNAFYEPGKNTFKMCSGFLLQSSSEFSIVWVLAHELSHSIDPCRISDGPEGMGFKYSKTSDVLELEKEFPIRNVISCLRDPRSVKARPKSSSMGQYASQAGGMSTEYASGAAMVDSSASLCGSDQISEAFSDWMAAEVLPTYIEQNHKLTKDQYRVGYSNTSRWSCENTKGVGVGLGSLAGLGVHPNMDERINKILLVNPKARQHMGCPSTHSENIYCDPNKSIEDEPSGSGDSSKKPLSLTPKEGTR